MRKIRIGADFSRRVGGPSQLDKHCGRLPHKHFREVRTVAQKPDECTSVGTNRRRNGVGSNHALAVRS
jgi:hypothetical protein